MHPFAETGEDFQKTVSYQNGILDGETKAHTFLGTLGFCFRSFYFNNVFFIQVTLF